MIQTLAAETYQWTLDSYRIAWEAGAFGDADLELLNGELYTVPPASPGHDWLVELLREFLKVKLEGQPVRVREEKTIFINESCTPRPDISVVQSQDYSELHPRPSDVYLAIEIANSNPQRDTELKRDIYAEAGIVQYWVFDIKNNTFRCYTDPTNGVYQESILWDGTVTLLNVEIAVADLLELAFGN